MAASKRSVPPKSPKRPAPAPPPPPSSQTRLGDQFIALLLRFSRFGWDLVGISLIVGALLSVLAFTGLTRGAWIDPWRGLLDRWFGWGTLILAAGIAVLGGSVFRRHSSGHASAHAEAHAEAHFEINLGQVLAWEGVTFSVLVLLSIFGAKSDSAAQGLFDPGWGGIVGWGLAELLLIGLGPALRLVVTILALTIFFLAALKVSGRITPWLADLAAQEEFRLAQEGTTAQSKGEPEGAPFAPPQSAVPTGRLPGQASRSGLGARGGKPQPGQELKLAGLPPRSERLPPLNLLMGEQTIRPDEQQIQQTAALIERTLAEFGVPAKVVGYRTGPTITQFAVEPGFMEKPGNGVNEEAIQRQKVRIAQIQNLAKDLALALSAERLRIEAPVPGRSYVGIEVPNNRAAVVRLRAILESEQFYRLGSPLGIALGRDVSGGPVVADLTRMPHLLIAGTTGSGKSVCIAALTVCLAINNTPADLRLVMIDPKMVELVRFNGLPHLLGKVETEIERILAVLRWALVEMEHRYRLLEQARARDLDNYNRKMQRHKQATLPRIVILIDELADLMMSAPDQTEHSLVRLAQMARAVGIHLVVATQRPSTDVVTGLIKANFPARISFSVASSIDSRVILDTNGAETLLGRGDMLFLSPEAGAPQRAQGVWVTDQELERVITFWQKMSPAPTTAAAPWEEILSQDGSSEDSLVDKAIVIVRGLQRASASMLQRRLRIGYPRAARLIDQLEEMGVVGPSQGGGRDREVLLDPIDTENEADPSDESTDT